MKSYCILLFLVMNVCGQPSKDNSKKNYNKTNKISMSTNSENGQNNPESVVKSLILAMSKNDAEQIRSLFHENTSQAYGNGDWKSGKDFFNWLQSDIIDRNGHVEDAKYEVEGNNVVVTGQYSSRGYTNKANFLFVVKKDKIKSWQMRY